MKAFLKNLKSILYLFKPYWKYNRKEMLLFIIVGSFIPAVATAGSVVYLSADGYQCAYRWQRPVLYHCNGGLAFQCYFPASVCNGIV